MWVAMVVISGCVITPKEEQKPNILFAISDDQSFVHTSFAGCKFINTPAFDRVAREGVYFTNCYAGSPGCAPSRSSIMTGRHHWQNEQSGQHASGWLKKYVPYVDMLNGNGYYTGYTGKGIDPFQYYTERVPNDSFRVENAAGKRFNDILYSNEGTAGDERFAKGIRNVNYFENFKKFMEKREEGKPFYFWYGASEPHRSYEKGSWKRMGKKLEDVIVPDFLPDNNEIRGDILDYAVEIEWFDLHLQRMINYLDSIGELDNTIIIVTSDQGMPFPRAKANCYEDGLHVPLAISYAKRFPGGRIVEDPISFINLAPTILELTETKQEGMLPITGQSIVNILTSDKESVVDTEKKYIFAGRERHSSSRYKNVGYPQRVIRSKDYLLVWNMHPERWPAGAPQCLKNPQTGELYPMYGIDAEGKYHTGWAFTDVDGSPTKSFLVEHYDDEDIRPYSDLAFAKRPKVELYDVKNDPFCLNNLSGKPEYEKIEDELKAELMKELKRSEDTRIVGPDKEIFESYIRYSHMREFPKPEWAE